MSKDTYNGWSNRETWLVSLHLREGDSRIDDLVQYDFEALSKAQKQDKGEVRHAIARTLEDRVYEISEDNGDISHLHTALLQGALDAVNWHEIADAFIAYFELSGEDEDEDEMAD